MNINIFIIKCFYIYIILYKIVFFQIDFGAGSDSFEDFSCLCTPGYFNNKFLNKEYGFDSKKVRI